MKKESKMLEVAEKLFAQYRNAVLYFVIGISAATIDLIIYVFLFNIVLLPAVVSTIISVFSATIFGFTMNIIFNFKVYDKLFLRFLSYSSVSGVGILLSASLLYLFHNIAGLDGNLVKVASLPVIFLTQYLLNKAISFKKKDVKEQLSDNQNI